jgi:hypothetical protein
MDEQGSQQRRCKQRLYDWLFDLYVVDFEGELSRGLRGGEYQCA